MQVFAAGMELISVAENLNVSARDLLASASENESGLPSPSHAFSSWRSLTEREKKERFLIMMVTAAIMIAFKNAFVGFLAGCLVWGLVRLEDRMEGLWGSRIGGSATEAARLLGS